MLDAFIIDQLERERERSQWEPIPLQLPIPSPRQPDGSNGEELVDEKPSDRGVVIIDNDGLAARL